MEWIDPIGGLGDSLILSSVLHDVWRTTGRQFGLCRRRPYAAFFRSHPAIAAIGLPAAPFQRIAVDYWTVEPPIDERTRPYQTLARVFGLPTPREELLWMPIGEAHFARGRHFPVEDGCVVVAPSSVSVRKAWNDDHWRGLVERIRGACDRMVVQIGMAGDRKIHGTVSLCGVTGPRDVCVLLKRAALAIAVDAFPLHAAAWAGVPTVGLWGPSDPEVFGYRWHRNVRSPVRCDQSCFPARDYDTYLSICRQESGHCMESIEIDHVWREVEPLL